MTRKRWLELYDTLEMINARLANHGMWETLPIAELMKELLIELKPPTEIKYTETHYADEPPF